MATTTTPIIPLVPSLTLKQKILGDATIGAKYIGLGGKGLGAVCAYIGLNVPSFPKTWLIAGSALAAIMIGIEQFSVDLNKLATTGTFSLSNVFGTIPNLVKTFKSVSADTDQLGTVKLEALTNPVVVVEDTLQQSSGIVDAAENSVKQ